MNLHSGWYLLGFVLIALSARPYLSTGFGKQGRDGQFIGLWAPSFLFLGKVMADTAVQQRGVLE